MRPLDHDQAAAQSALGRWSGAPGCRSHRAPGRAPPQIAPPAPMDAPHLLGKVGEQDVRAFARIGERHRRACASRQDNPRTQPVIAETRATPNVARGSSPLAPATGCRVPCRGPVSGVGCRRGHALHGLRGAACCGASAESRDREARRAELLPVRAAGVHPRGPTPVRPQRRTSMAMRAVPKRPTAVGLELQPAGRFHPTNHRPPFVRPWAQADAIRQRRIDLRPSSVQWP